MSGGFSSGFSNGFDIAPASVGCGFSSGFSNGFDVCPVTPGLVVEVDTHDGRPRRDAEPDRQSERRSRQQALREAVETAFRAAYDEPEAAQPAAEQPLARKEVRRIARQMLPDLEVGGLTATLGEVATLIEQYQLGLILERQAALKARQNQDALLVLLLTQ